ncbi:MAG: aminopeptidase N [Maricaulaceae bacterium]
MRTDAAPKPTLLEDYTVPNYIFDQVELDFDLVPNATVVKSKIAIRRNPDSDGKNTLNLDGEDIVLRGVSIDGKALNRKNYKLTKTQLILSDLPDSFTLEIETLCDPAANSKLMGLYVSGGRFCTQCEAEGFRRITYYMDRPDALSVFKVRMSAGKADYPYLLANGNMVDSGDLDGGKHFAVWEDPFPKPCYLFALVAGQFDTVEDNFTTMTGRDIPLAVYVDPGDAPRAEYAMDALKRSMKWDEEVYGREYDLDRFMIVGVRDFNFGAMENKGLNIFNSSLLLADEASATDMNFERIESVVAHEYFHNWTGNRITCRDWFQLCLKEGFTVFRDQEFSADQRGAAVQRIKDVVALRARQFPEDAGPLAHPPRPDHYLKIDNFYTATIYEKGAEIVRMLRTILGDAEFRKGCDYYFDTLDGTAATVEQFIDCFAKSSGQDLRQFFTWYKVGGTPHVKTNLTHRAGTATVSFEQSVPTQSSKEATSPRVIPVKWQLIGDNGPVTEPKLSILRDTLLSETVDLGSHSGPLTLSAFQDFSAPIVVKTQKTTDDLIRQMGQDPNAFNRWEAGQSIARGLLSNMTRTIQNGTIPDVDNTLARYCVALSQTLASDEFDDAYKALMLSTPSSSETIQALANTDPIAAYEAGQWLRRAIGERLFDPLLVTYHDKQSDGSFSPDARQAGQRALKNRALELLVTTGRAEVAPLVLAQFESASNMTDEFSALTSLTHLGGKRVEESVDEFYDKWKENALVVDKWFMLQGSRKTVEGINALQTLTEHPVYDRRNPNRVRSLLGGFVMNNPRVFHHHSGSGYKFFSNEIKVMDRLNPQIAARLLGVFEVWRKLDRSRQTLIREQLENIISTKPSKNVLEIAEKILS